MCVCVCVISCLVNPENLIETRMLQMEKGERGERAGGGAGWACRLDFCQAASLRTHAWSSLALLALLSQLSYSLKIWSVFEFQFGLTLSWEQESGRRAANTGWVSAFQLSACFFSCCFCTLCWLYLQLFRASPRSSAVPVGVLQDGFIHNQKRGKDCFLMLFEICE